jgi:signal transduction histidine kinase
LSDQLLSLARAGNEPLKQSRVDLSALTKNEIGKLSKRYSVTIDLSPSKSVFVWADAPLLRQVLDIIVENAVVYNESKTPSISVKIITSPSTTKLQVADNGPGINPADLPHIFDRFYRGKNASRNNSQGHGLGLALAHDIVRRHDGVLVAHSKLGSGTTFTIQLPKYRNT